MASLNSSPPLVGVSACVRAINTIPFHTVNQRYLIALTEVSGTLPMLVPALGERLDFEDLVSRLDGLVVTGSPSNVEPHHYGRERAADDILHDPARDATTLPLIREAVRQDVPVFAICRGIQELNVALGGTLHQFLHAVPGRRDHRSDKSKPITERWMPAHMVDLVEGGMLHRLAGTARVMVNSLHGQAIDAVAPDLEVEATAEDGTVEAVRVRSANTFALGVQWHPEALCQTCGFARSLFEEFGRATERRAAARGRPQLAAAE